MDLSNLPPPHGSPLGGEQWFRGLAKPEQFLTAMREDFFILVVGCMMKYIRLEKSETGLTFKARIVKQFSHGVDGVAYVCGCPYRDVYALAEKRLKPRIFMFQIHKTDKGELEPHYMHSLKRINSWDIRSMQFLSKELLVILTGIPTFNVVLFRWNTNEELMTSNSNEPNLFSKLLVNPSNPCQWMEYGEDYMFVYEMPSLARTDVIRTKINLPKRHILYDHPDPQMGRALATRIVSACWTNVGDFFILDERLGIHKFVPETKVLQWTCSLTQTFLGPDVAQIVPYETSIAAITSDGWFLQYGDIALGGKLEVITAFKLSSHVLRYIHFPDNPDTFFAVTESKGMIEGVTQGLLRDPFAIPDLMFANILSCCFIEPNSDYMVIVTKFGKCVVLECETGAPIAKWKLPFRVVGVISHPVLPFLFCGTDYGCINVLDTRNLKTPKLINRRFFSREPNPWIDKFGFVSQGRYLVSADTSNNRIFVQYGYPFMSFDFIDTAKVPARISHISVPGCGKDDNKFQVYMSGKSPSDEGVVAFVINFSLRNDRLMVVASQSVDQPVTAMCFSPIPKSLYVWLPLKKGLGVVPYCDDNQWLSLQEPEYLIEHKMRFDVTFMVFHGTRLYTFHEDGYVQYHNAPVLPKKKIQLPMVLESHTRIHTHTYSDCGIREGIVSFDGSQVIAIGYDGTFCRVRMFHKPAEPEWQVLGYDRPKLVDYQVGTYLIDQEFYKAGEDFLDRIADIKVKIDQIDPVNFYQGDETETEDEDEQPVIPQDTPKGETVGEKFKYGPRRSFKGTVTRTKKAKSVKIIPENEPLFPASTTDDQQKSSSGSDKGKKRVTISASQAITTLEGLESEGETKADDISLQETSAEEMSEVPTDPTSGERKASMGRKASAGSASPARKSKAKKSDAGEEEAESVMAETKKEDSQSTGSSDSPPKAEEIKEKQKSMYEQRMSQRLSKAPAHAASMSMDVDTEVLMQAEKVEEVKSTVEQLPASAAIAEQATETSTLQKLLSKVQEATPAMHLEPKAEAAPVPEVTADDTVPVAKSPPKEDQPKEQVQQESPPKTATTAALKGQAPTGAALKNVLSERLKRKQMAKVKSTTKHEPGKSKHDAKSDEKEAEQAPTTDTEAGPEEDTTATQEETTETKDGDDEEEDEGPSEAPSAAEMKFQKGLKGLKALKTAKILSSMFGKGKKKETKKGEKKKKIKKFQGGQAGKMLEEASAAPSKLKAPASKTTRTRMGQAKIMKQMIEEEKMESQQVQKKRKVGGKRRSRGGGEQSPGAGLSMVEHLRKGRKDQQSEASRALLIEVEMTKNLETSVLRDPAIQLLPEKPAKPYEGLDVEDVLTVDHVVRKKEYTEAEFFAQYEKTLLYRQHVPKAQALRREFLRFTELMEELMFFNRQREEGNQVEMKEFNFDEDREGRLREKSDKMKKLANIQMVVRNKLRHARINAMKFLVWEQFETKGMTIMGFRKKLEVSNYPLLPESEFYEGAVKEAISWRRLEQRLELEEEECLKDGNQHALRVLTHEMQFMSPAKKRLYMKSIMAIDPTARFDDYEASDSDKSDNEFFSKVFEELGIALPEDAQGEGAKGVGSEIPGKAKTAVFVGAAMTASKAASKFLDKRKNKYTEAHRKSDAQGYVEKLKKLLLEEQEREEQAEMFRLQSEEASTTPSETEAKEQSRRDFMVNIKPSKAYYHPKGIFGPRGSKTEAEGPRKDDVEFLMDPNSKGQVDGKGNAVSEVASGVNKDGGAMTTHPSKKKFKAVTRQKKKMKFQKRPDVVFEEEEDLSGPEDEAVNVVQRKKFDAMDDEYKERFDTINNIFFGSSLSELIDMYQFKPANFRYSQFDMGSRHELWRHQFIIMSEIYQLKKFFNRQFELLRNSKQYCLRKMSDRNERIREIYYYLKVDLDILDEKWRLQEDPSQIFTVSKDEIPVERYLTAEQRRIEEQRRLEDLARRRTRMAEFRKKALYIMMDNRLEVKREEILVNDIPKPNFMLEKDPLEFTLEEYLQSLQYAEAVEALEKARVDMIKELEEELGRLYRANAMDINTIDLRVTELSLMKFQFHQNVQMEETRILRAIRQLRMMEELDKEEKRISKVVNELKSSMKSSQHMIAQLEAKKTACEEEIAKFAEQEKDLERNFRRDLGDVGTYFEFFYKNYKKKPKLSLKGLNKAEVYETMVRALRSDNIRAFARDNGETGRIVVMAIYDMEDPMLMPKDCPRSYWDRFNRVRRERLVCDYQTKTLLSEIDRITEGINECLRKEEDGTAAIAAVLGVLSHKNDLKNYFVANVEFQMVLGKGQCEIDCWDFDQHINANIILIQNVEKLNSRIFDASEKLIKEMSKTAAVHRDIKEVEWRFLVVEMATKDLKKVRHDVGCFKPTKKLLEILRRGINLDTMHTDRIALVDYLRDTYVKYQKIFLRTKKKLLMFYKTQTKRRQQTNELYKGDIFEQTEILVADQVSKVTPDMTKISKNENEKRAVQLMLQGYLNRKIIRICNEVEKLEEELEKQYQRTYPVL